MRATLLLLVSSFFVVALCLPNKQQQWQQVSSDPSPYCCDGISDCVQHSELKLGDTCPTSGQPAETEGECIASCCKTTASKLDTCIKALKPNPLTTATYLILPLRQGYLGGWRGLREGLGCYAERTLRGQ